MSPKTGRPKVDNPNDVNLTVRISKELSQRLTEYCTENFLSKGEVVREGIEHVLTAKRK